MIILIVFFALFSVFSHDGTLYWYMECSTLLDQDLGLQVKNHLTYAQTKFLISLMKNQLDEDGDDLPKSIQELNNHV